MMINKFLSFHAASVIIVNKRSYPATTISVDSFMISFKVPSSEKIIKNITCNHGKTGIKNMLNPNSQGVIQEMPIIPGKFLYEGHEQTSEKKKMESRVFIKNCSSRRIV